MKCLEVVFSICSKIFQISVGLKLFLIERGFFTLPLSHSDNNNKVTAIFKMPELSNTLQEWPSFECEEIEVMQQTVQ